MQERDIITYLEANRLKVVNFISNSVLNYLVGYFLSELCVATSDLSKFFNIMEKCFKGKVDQTFEYSFVLSISSVTLSSFMLCLMHFP